MQKSDKGGKNSKGTQEVGKLMPVMKADSR